MSTTSDQPAPDAHAPSTARGVAKSVGWLMAARLSTMLTSLAATAVLARVLSPADFGVLAVVLISANLAAALVEGAVSVPLVQRPSATAAHIRTALLLGLALSSVAAAGFVLVGTRLFADTGKASVAGIVAVAALVIPIRACISVLAAVLQRQGSFRQTAAVALTSSVLGNAIPSVALAFAGFGVWSLLAGLFLSSLVEAALMVRAARLPPFPWRSAVREFSETARDFRALGCAGTLMQIVNWAALNCANAIVGALFGTAALGLYSRGAAMINIAKDVFGTSLARVLLPAFAGLHRDPAKQRRAFERALSFLLPILAVASAMTVVHAEAIVLVTLGGGWRDTILVLQLLACGLLPRVGYKVAEALPMARGGFWPVAGRQTVYLILLVAFGIAGSRFGIAGVAAGVSVATIAYYLLALSAAATSAGSSRIGLALLHLQAAAWAAGAVAADLAILHLAAPLGFWPAQLLGGAVTGAVAGALLAKRSMALLGKKAPAPEGAGSWQAAAAPTLTDPGRTVPAGSP